MGNLALKTIKSKSTEMDQTEVFEIEDGAYKGEQITFFPTFSETKIEELVKELSVIQHEINDNSYEVDDEMQLYLIQLLSIKHFTHFKDSMPSKLIGKGEEDGLLDWLEHFRKTGLFKLILDDVFSPTEVQKVLDFMTDFTSKAMLQMDLEKKTQETFERLKLKFKPTYDQLEKMTNDFNARNVLADNVQ